MPFPYSDDNKRYHTVNYYLKHRFGKKVAKLPLNGGFTCPNRDGTCGFGGCTYCSGSASGDFAGDPALSVTAQLSQMKKIYEQKWPNSLFIPYFQAGSGTYAPVPRLRNLYEEALSFPDVVGLSVATRPDCLPDEVLDLLEEFSRRTFLTVELGLQTVHDQTAAAIHRGHDLSCFVEGCRKLSRRNIPFCVHIINGLPGETEEMMLETARFVGRLRPFAVKIHLLHLLRGTVMGEEYLKNPFPLMEKEQYVSLVCEQLRVLPPETVVERVTGDGDRKALIGPMWSLRKREVLNAIDQKMAQLDAMQGDRFSQS